jgi:hypothetical protein
MPISWNLALKLCRKTAAFVEIAFVEIAFVEIAFVEIAFVEIWSRLIYIWPQEEVLVMRVVLTLGDERTELLPLFRLG